MTLLERLFGQNKPPPQQSAGAPVAPVINTGSNGVPPLASNAIFQQLFARRETQLNRFFQNGNNSSRQALFLRLKNLISERHFTGSSQPPNTGA